MHRECRERFPHHQFQRKPLVSDPGMHHGTCVMHVPWCMSGSLTLGGGKNVPGIPGACATRNFTYLARGPWRWGRIISPHWRQAHLLNPQVQYLQVFPEWYLPAREVLIHFEIRSHIPTPWPNPPCTRKGRWRERVFPAARNPSLAILASCVGRPLKATRNIRRKHIVPKPECPLRKISLTEHFQVHSW